MGKIDSLVMIPTYNEAENIVELLDRVLSNLGTGEVLVIDDGSPDGTAQRVEEQFGGEPRVHLLKRNEKSGLGSAYKAGFRWGLKRDYKYFFQMDADFSHSPDKLPELYRGLEDYDCVIGSRYVRGGGIENWGPGRKTLSYTANFTVRWLLGLQVKDCTSGYRGYRRSIIETIDMDTVSSGGYVYLVEFLSHVIHEGVRVKEIPITFVDRRVGESKMNQWEIIFGFKRVLELALSRLFGK